jgi:hypothetical protein
MYAFPADPYALSMLPYSFSICRAPRTSRQHEHTDTAAAHGTARHGRQ